MYSVDTEFNTSTQDLSLSACQRPADIINSVHERKDSAMTAGTTAVGIDIVAVARIRRLLTRYGDRFIARVLGDDERKLLASRTDRAQFVAGRFAAKEAAIKALGRYQTERPSFPALQVLPGPGGVPEVKMDNNQVRLPKNVTALVSLSHEREYATAIVILTETT
jgi:holo-[acyl-carrier protein] synthase